MDSISSIKVYLLLSVLVGSLVLDSSASTSAVTDENETPSSNTLNEIRGLEISGLQGLRSGLAVARSITQMKILKALNISEEEDRDTLDATTRLRLILTLMCNMTRALEALWEIPVDASDNEVNFLRRSAKVLVNQTCEWAKVRYQKEFQNSELIFNCQSFHQISSMCLHLNTMLFTETLDGRFQIYQSDLNFAEPTKDVWINENIQQANVLPEVYDVISRQ